MRIEKIECVVVTGTTYGKHSRGRLREIMAAGMAQWLHKAGKGEMLRATNEKDDWRDMIAYAAKHGTT